MPRQYFLLFILLFSFVPSIEAESMEEGMTSKNTRNVVPPLQKNLEKHIHFREILVFTKLSLEIL